MMYLTFVATPYGVRKRPLWAFHMIEGVHKAIFVPERIEAVDQGFAIILRGKLVDVGC